MPFKLTNALAIFQGLMNRIFNQYLCRFVLAFFDDILVYNINAKLYESNLNIIFEILEENQLYINMSKCSFGQAHISYVGHVVSKQRIEMDLEKVKTVIGGLFQLTSKSYGVSWDCQDTIKNSSKIHQKFWNYSKTTNTSTKEECIPLEH